MRPLTSSQVGQVLVHALRQGGVDQAVVSPGSRSAPIALALAAVLDPTDLHVRVDERTAAFLALGLARGSGQPVVVTCSSGTATANYLPAVIEADAAGVPLVVLTADRPPEMRHTGANQTIDQVGLYGGAVRFAADLSGVGGPDDEGYLRGMVAQAVASATGPWPGPVHLNVPLREPLLDDTVDHAWAQAIQDRTGPSWTAVTPARTTVPAGHADRHLRGRPTVVVVGEGAVGTEGLLPAAERLGMPVLAEPTSGLRADTALRCGHWLAATPAFVAAHRPEVVVQLGRPVLSRAVGALVASADDVVTLDPLGRGWDPGHHTTLRVPAAFADWTADATPGDPAFLDAWRRADDVAARVLDQTVDAAPHPTEIGVARDVAAAVPDGGTLVVASSLAVRNLNEAMRPRTGLRVLGNRGASGIDGFTSTAVGVALTSDGPTVALAGDLSIVHDLTGLVVGPDEPVPSLPIVVVDNGGGGIFDLLPYGTAVEPATFRRLFATPHGVPLHGVAITLGHGFAHVDERTELAQVLEDAWGTPGITLIEVTTSTPTETARRREIARRVGSALA